MHLLSILCLHLVLLYAFGIRELIDISISGEKNKGDGSYNPLLAFIFSILSSDLDVLTHYIPSFLEINPYIPYTPSYSTNL